MSKKTIRGQIDRYEKLLKQKKKAGNLTWSEIRSITEKIGNLYQQLKNAH